MTALDTGDRVGALTRARASVAAVEMLALIRRQARTVATDAERVVLSGWSGWGPLASVFAPKEASWAELHERLTVALDEKDLKLGMQGTYNAFYTPRPVAETMWSMLREFGFTGGPVVELGCGGGMFFGTAPEGVTLAGVERDPTAAGICKLLYPDARVVTDELQNVQLGSGAAAVIGNVPYGKVSVFDPMAPESVKTNLHNYFIWRAVQALAPGGYAMVLTSRFTMDATGSLPRTAIGVDADFVGAVRLPNGALIGGGTEAGADIVILRRKVPNGRRTYGRQWSNTTENERLGTGLRYNEFWDEEPGAVIGRMVKGQTTQHGLGLQVEDKGRSASEVLDMVRRYTRMELVDQARKRGLMWQEPPQPDRLDGEALATISREGWHEGTMRLTDAGGVLVVKDGRANPIPKPGKELLALLRLRDLAVELVEAEADYRRSDASIDPVRADTAAAYEAYVKKFGALNRCKMIRGAVDAETGLPTWSRRYPTMQGFRYDPHAPLVFALEIYEDDEDELDEDDPTGTSKASPAHILSSRQNRAPAARVRADNIEQALLWCLDAKGGRVDLDYIALLMGRRMPVMEGSPDDRDAIHERIEAEREQVAGLLGDRIYLEPQTRQWQTAEEYLSDDVREKHVIAQQAASEDKRFDRNVAALAKVLPQWLGPEDITANLGTPWIGPSIVAEFIAETIGYEVAVKRVPAGNHWEVETNRILKSSVAATARWGTADVDAFTLVEKALNNTVPVVYREVPDGSGGTKTVKDAEATVLATEKQQEIRNEFNDWVWRDTDRADKLLLHYNTNFNNVVPRKFDGAHITIEGMADWFKPYAHQLDTVARAMATGATLCGLPVGAGKTYIMAMVAMKLRQVGLARKPMLVVPNHLIEQIDREIRQLFPMAKILTGAAKGISKNRRAFTARCATQEWDMVLVTHSAFNAMDVDPDTQQRYIEELQGELYEGVVEGAGGELAGRMVKRLAKQLDTMTAKIKELRDKIVGRDAGVRFEQLGVDYLEVDEFHYYKNLAVPVRTDGFSIRPSKRATDLDMKLRWLSERGSGRYAALFSGTPMSNTMLELYVCMHYTMRPYLKKIGIGSPDAWAAAFVQFVTGVEVTVDGGDFRMHTRPALFVNVPELRSILARVADTRTAEQIGLKRPKSELRVIAIEPTDSQQAYSMDLVDRAERCRTRGGKPSKGADCMLKVCGDGRRMATDPLLVGIDDDGRYKLHVVADHIIDIWQQHPGMLQIAFCDIGTPHDPRRKAAEARRKARKENEALFGAGFGSISSPHRDGIDLQRMSADLGDTLDGMDMSDWGELGGDLASELAGLDGPKPKAEPVQMNYQTYGRLRRILVDAGMDVRRIRFIHDAKDDAAKAQLFKDCRAGKVDVIVGSTDKLGVGTNIQKLVVALHHIDAPFRPADVEQRDGRGVRPKNINPLVYIYRYVTKRTFDAYMWQMLHRKITFISQMLSGENIGRTAEDITGDDVMSFAAIKAAATDQPLLEEKVKVESEIKKLRSAQRGHRVNVEQCRRDAPRMRETAKAAATDATVWEQISAAEGLELTDELITELHEMMEGSSRYRPPTKQLADGVTLEWRTRYVQDVVKDSSETQPEMRLVTAAGFQSVPGFNFWKPFNVKNKLGKLLAGAAEAAVKCRATEARLLRNADEAQQLAGEGFTQQEALNTALARLDQIDAELRQAAVKNDGPGADAVIIKAEPEPELVEVDFADLDGLTDFTTEVQDELLADLADLFA